MKSFVSIFICMVTLFVTSCAAAKIAEYNDADASEFKFENYNSAEAFWRVMNDLFPVGTKRSYIELVLAERGQAQIHDNGRLYFKGHKIESDERIVSYTKVDETSARVKCQFIYTVLYTKENVSKNFNINYGCDGP